MNKTVKKEL